MSGEQATNSDAGTVTSQSSEVETAASQDDNESLLNQDSGDQLEHTEEENEDIDVDGKKFALPKSAAEKLKAERMMHADYTQKTQSVAEERKAVAAEREQVQRQSQEHQQYIQDYAKVVALDDQLAELNKIDLAQYVDTDPQGVQRIMLQKQALESQRNQAANAVMQKQQQHAMNEQQSIAKQVHEADAYFKREIPGWTAARSDQLLQYGVAAGIPSVALSKAVLNQPALAKLLHKAELYDSLLKKQAPKPAAPPEAKPVPQVGGNASAKKDPTKMSPSEFRAYRQKIISKR